MQARMLRNIRPQTGLEAKFSMQFAMAAALVARKVGLAELTDDFVRRPDVQAIFPRVSISTTSEIAGGANFAPFDAVEIITARGQTLASGPVAHAKGSPQNPLLPTELFGKFSDCLGAEFPDAKKLRAFERLMTFHKFNGTGDLAL
jgi:2-methylcitrate dehydratase PrpD